MTSTSHIQEGDIIRGAKIDRNEAYHPIIYLGENDNVYFLGAMMTHSSDYDNIKLEEYHFEEKIDTNPKPSFIVKNYLLKRQEWAPFDKVGKLSFEGINFVKTCLKDTKPELWEDFNP